MSELLMQKLPNAFLIGLFLYLVVWMVVRDFSAKTVKGVIVSLADILDSDGCGRPCCTSGLPLKVRLMDQSVVEAEVSPCSLCLEGLKPGDVVCLTPVGGRLIATKAGSCREASC